MQSRVRIRPIALPTEHGGWSLTLEPIVLGLLVAPSLSGFLFGLATVGAFLARHPYKIVMGDRRRARRFPRTAVAESFLLLYGGIALVAVLAALTTASSYAFLWPLVGAAPLAAIQLFFDAKGESRALAPELAGAAGLAAVAASIALAGGLPLSLALALWAVLAARVVASILYVRARLILLHGERPSRMPTVVSHVAALACVSLLAWLRLTPPVAALAFLLLLLRAVHGLSRPPRVGTAKQVGITEIVYGLLVVVAAAAAQLFG